MSSDPVRILCTGDLHLGRRPTRVPPENPTWSVEYVWEKTVDYAVRQDVDVLALTGDVVDRENRYYESLGPLQRGLDRLGEAAVEVVAVTGNHDYDVLPQLEEVLEGDHFHLLGRGGTWEEYRFAPGGDEEVRFVGWSFPARTVRGSPVETLDTGPSEVPTVGLMHADLSGSESRYAPVEAPDLEGRHVDFWLLGHIHRPGRHELARGWALYPGSPQPLDPGERGVHGPWVVEVEGPTSARTRQLPLAPLAYEELSVEVDGVEDRESFRERVVSTVREDLERRREEADELRRVVYRLRIVGRTAAHRSIDGYMEELLGDPVLPYEELEAVVDDYRLATRPEIDLEDLARGTDPPGVLAQLLLDLEDGAVPEELDRSMREALERIRRANAYQPLRRSAETPDVPEEEERRELLRRQGLLLLDELVAQKEDAA